MNEYFVTIEYNEGGKRHHHTFRIKADSPFIAQDIVQRRYAEVKVVQTRNVNGKYV